LPTSIAGRARSGRTVCLLFVVFGNENLILNIFACFQVSRGGRRQTTTTPINPPHSTDPRDALHQHIMCTHRIHASHIPQWGDVCIFCDEHRYEQHDETERLMEFCKHIASVHKVRWRCLIFNSHYVHLQFNTSRRACSVCGVKYMSVRGQLLLAGRFNRGVKMNSTHSSYDIGICYSFVFGVLYIICLVLLGSMYEHEKDHVALLQRVNDGIDNGNGLFLYLNK
jgi:hypothetical protein